jgi:hypothetical protein
VEVGDGVSRVAGRRSANPVVRFIIEVSAVACSTGCVGEKPLAPNLSAAQVRVEALDVVSHQLCRIKLNLRARSR